MSIKEDVRNMKLVSPYVAAMSVGKRNTALKSVAEAIEAKKNEIFAENEKDLAAAKENNVADAVVKRLKFNEDKLRDVIKGINQLIELPDPLGRKTLARQLDEGLILNRVTCPIGVIGVIFEARPDAMVQISSLCIKSGNCAILKGGKETANTNRILFEIINDAVISAGFPKGCLLLAETHSEIDELLDCYGLVDLLIPRGSNSFVQYIMNNTKIPVRGHADGICHIYVDAAADQEKAIPIILDAKTQYTAACNAVETLLINRSIAREFVPKLAAALAESGIELKGTKEVTELLDELGCLGNKAETGLQYEEITESDFKEYLALKVSAKLVEDVDEAIGHINRFGSHHTDSILTEDDDIADRFMQLVDSAGVYQNCSTRFADARYRIVTHCNQSWPIGYIKTGHYQ